MWPATAATLLLIGQLPLPATESPAISTAADAMAVAYADAAKLPPDLRYTTRYLSLHDLTEKEKKDLQALTITAGHLNQLSRTRLIQKPTVLAGGLLMRINLIDYGWTPDLWEKLIDPGMYLVQEHTGEWPAGKPWSDGKTYSQAFKYKERRAVPGIWLYDAPSSEKAVDELQHWTNSRVPVVRATWFFNQTATAADSRLYYEFIGAKDRKTFEEGIGFERKLFERFRLPLREAVARSGVTLQPRALAFFDSAGGGYTYSIDFIHAKGKKNPLSVIGEVIETLADAFEAFGLAPNGFWRTALFNAKGELQATAPPEIANDRTSPSNDTRIHVNVSCVTCHTNGGMKDPAAYFRNLLNPPVELRSKDHEKYQEAREQYLTDLKEFIDRVRPIYERAVKAATGLDSKKYAAAYGAFWWHYENAEVDTAWAAKSLGTTPAELRRVLNRTIKDGYYDHVAKVQRTVSNPASTFVHEGKHAQTIGIRQFEEVIPELQLILHLFKGKMK